ncbi:uncharacterized protein LOC120334557 [Styela clava]
MAKLVLLVLACVLNLCLVFGDVLPRNALKTMKDLKSPEELVQQASKFQREERITLSKKSGFCSVSPGVHHCKEKKTSPKCAEVFCPFKPSYAIFKWCWIGICLEFNLKVYQGIFKQYAVHNKCRYLHESCKTGTLCSKVCTHVEKNKNKKLWMVVQNNPTKLAYLNVKVKVDVCKCEYL